MKTHFFLGKLYQKYFLLFTIITLVIIHTMFGLILTTPWPDDKELSLKFAIREIRKISFENPVFFLGKQSYANLFSWFTLSLHWLYSIPSLVWFWPGEKELILKFAKKIREFRKIPYENPIFS